MTGSDRPRHQRPTMLDVATSAGVSIKTVSRVVNGSDYVSADKAHRVRLAIGALGFRPNEGARQLRYGRTAMIGLVLEDVANPFYSALTRAVEEVAFDRGHMLLSASSAADPRRAEQVIELLAGRGVGGLIVTPAQSMNPTPLQRELAAGTSMVFVDRPMPGIDADTVLIDNRGGAADGTRQLIAHGHRRIAFFGDERAVFTAVERRQGFLDAHRVAGLPVDDRLIVMTSPTGGDGDAMGMVEPMLRLDAPPTAIVSGNNRWSIRLLRALRSRPSPLAFIGFDDFELADVLQPAITVIEQDPGRMGRRAAEALFRRMDGADGPTRSVELPTTLIRRGSGELPGPFAN